MEQSVMKTLLDALPLVLVEVWPTIPGEHLVSSGEEDEHYVPKRNDFFEKVPRV
jgi:hypothetical protein